MKVDILSHSELNHRSCAAVPVQCLFDAGIADWETAFKHHIDNAKQLGLMPDDFKVIKKTMQEGK